MIVVFLQLALAYFAFNQNRLKAPQAIDETTEVTEITLSGNHSLAIESDHDSCIDSNILLIPDHESVQSHIQNMVYLKDLAYMNEEAKSLEKVVIISTDPVNQESSIYAGMIRELWPAVEIESWLVNANTTEAELSQIKESFFRNELETSLYIFSTAFSQDLPGDVAHVHDLRSIDVLEAHSYDEISTLDVAAPQVLELMITLANDWGQAFQHTLNINPAWDLDLDTFENTSYLFACALPGEPRDREYGFFIDFAYPEEWYHGRTEEDRYLEGYDLTQFETAEINNSTEDKLVIFELDQGGVEHFDFNYWR